MSLNRIQITKSGHPFLKHSSVTISYRYHKVLTRSGLSSNDGSEFGGSIYQKVSDKLETAVSLAWTAGSNSTRFGIGAKYQLDKDASISVSGEADEWKRLQK